MVRIMLKKRIVMSIFGLLISAFAVGLFRMARFGVDPFQALMNGLDKAVPLDFGTTYLIANVILFLFMLAADRHYIGIVTFLNMFFFGYLVDFSHRTLLQVFGEPGIPGRVAFLLFGIVVLCFGAAFYYTADLGVSVYDAVSLIIANTWHIWQFKFIRMTADLICVAGGIVLFIVAGGSWTRIGEVAGIGTIVTAFFMGPLIDFFRVKITDPMLAQDEQRQGSSGSIL